MFKCCLDSIDLKAYSVNFGNFLCAKKHFDETETLKSYIKTCNLYITSFLCNGQVFTVTIVTTDSVHDGTV